MNSDTFTHLRMFLFGWPFALVAHNYGWLDIPPVVEWGLSLIWLPTLYITLTYSAAAVQRREVESEAHQPAESECGQ